MLLVAGIFIVLEAIASVAFSKDQRSVSTIGRALRILVGTFLIFPIHKGA